MTIGVSTTNYINDIRELREEFEHYSFNMPGYSWELGWVPATFGAPFIMFTIRTMDTYDRVPHPINIEANIPLPPFPIPREWFPHMLQDAIRQAVLHEADEWFKKDGVIVFNPHEPRR